MYSEGVEGCDIYIGLFGIKYGYEDAEGVSPTEREFDLASASKKIRLIFIKDVKERDSKEMALIAKAEREVTRKTFGSYDELQTAVYASLVDYLSDKEYIRRLPFDATLANNANIDDIDSEKIRKFIRLAGSKRGFPLGESVKPIELLTHLNLCHGTLNGTLNDSQKAVLDYISKNDGVNATILIEKLSIPRDTINKIIRYLIDQNLIERRGSKKTGGYWCKAMKEIVG